MSDSPKTADPLGLTPSRQRTVWIMLLLVASVALWWTFSVGRWVDEPIIVHRSDVDAATYLIDPNTAT